MPTKSKCGIDLGHCLFNLGREGICAGTAEAHARWKADYPNLQWHDYDGGCPGRRSLPNQYGEVHCTFGHLVEDEE